MTKRLMRLEVISPKMDDLSGASNGNAEKAAEDKEEEMKVEKTRAYLPFVLFQIFTMKNRKLFLKMIRIFLEYKMF
jgi:hypothetical protein